MKRKKYEEKMVKQRVAVETKVYCDVCGKEITRDNKDAGYDVQTHHSDWGNDSVDSFEYFDLCSIECLTKHMNEYFNDECIRRTSAYDIEKKF